MSTFSAQPVVVDGKAHLLGRLASIVSKQVSLALAHWKGIGDRTGIGNKGNQRGAGRDDGCRHVKEVLQALDGTFPLAIVTGERRE